MEAIINNKNENQDHIIENNINVKNYSETIQIFLF